MSKRGMPSILILAGLLAISAPTAAQTSAREASERCLRLAAAAYEDGLLPEVLGMLSPDNTDCQGQTHSQIAQGLELFAMALLASNQADAAAASVDSILKLRPGFTPSRGARSPRFVRLVRDRRHSRTTRLVSSVSKSPEELALAPATVVMVTAEEIAERGYTHLEEVIYDLPGFQVARSGGFVTSNLYQRGYRSDETNRLLLLVDGVEENNLSGNEVYLAGQYPLSNVSKVEVVYGPASTMYGPNAFLGVINIITKTANDLAQGSNTGGFDVRALRGSFNSGGVDATAGLSLPTRNTRGTITVRYYRSDGQDLSSYDAWDYDPGGFEVIDYRTRLRLVGDGAVAFDEELVSSGIPDCSASTDCLFRIHRSAEAVDSVTLTDAGRSSALASDQAALTHLVNGAPLRFSDPSEDFYVRGQVTHGDFAIGVHHWSRSESPASGLVDLFHASGDNGVNWVPTSTALWASYHAQVLDQLSLRIFTRYKRHGLGEDSRVTGLRGYATGHRSLLDLMRGETSGWVEEYSGRSNTQLRTELSAVYQGDALDLSTGVEVRYSSIGASNITSPIPFPLQTGEPASSIDGGNRIHSRDVGLYLQGATSLVRNVRLVIGGRLDHNRLQSNSGFGWVFNPRVALVGSPGSFTTKLVFSQAFKVPSNFERFQTFGPDERPNPGLAPERASNVEAMIGWRPNRHRVPLELDVAFFRTAYSDLVGRVQDPSPGGFVFQNGGAIRVVGVQAFARYDLGEVRLVGNYTYTDPEQGDAGVRVRDIAAHTFNVAAARELASGVTLSLRANHVGERPTGFGTTSPIEEARQVDASTLFHAAVRFAPGDLGVSAQLAVRNLFDTEYVHPGVGLGDGFLAPAVHPQPGRELALRLSWSW